MSTRTARPKRNEAAQSRQLKSAAKYANQMCSMDFVADNPFDGKKLRMLDVVDGFTHESLAVNAKQSLKRKEVVRVVDAIANKRGVPQSVKAGNGSEFIGKAMDKWTYERKAAPDFSRPGKPKENAMVESFNGRLRE